MSLFICIIYCTPSCNIFCSLKWVFSAHSRKIKRFSIKTGSILKTSDSAGLEKLCTAQQYASFYPGCGWDQSHSAGEIPGQSALRRWDWDESGPMRCGWSGGSGSSGRTWSADQWTHNHSVQIAFSPLQRIRPSRPAWSPAIRFHIVRGHQINLFHLIFGERIIFVRFSSYSSKETARLVMAWESNWRQTSLDFLMLIWYSRADES